MPNGTAALIYLHPDHADRAARLEAFLREQEWAGQVIPARDLGSIGQARHNGLAFAVSLRADQAANSFGIPGRALAATPKWDKADRLGFGQHSGLARFEQSPVLMIQGEGFAAGKVNPARVHVVDLAPSIMRHLAVDAPGMDGTALQNHL
jgi:hypothetical protein